MPRLAPAKIRARVWMIQGELGEGGGRATVGVRPSTDLEEWPHRRNVRAAGEIDRWPNAARRKFPSRRFGTLTSGYMSSAALWAHVVRVRAPTWAADAS